MKIDMSAVGTSEPYNVNPNQSDFRVGLYVAFDATFVGEYTVEMEVYPGIWVNHDVLTKRYSQGSAVMGVPFDRVRLRVLSVDVAGTVSLIVRQGG